MQQEVTVVDYCSFKFLLLHVGSFSAPVNKSNKLRQTLPPGNLLEKPLTM
jgi:hypothetical protein